MFLFCEHNMFKVTLNPKQGYQNPRFSDSALGEIIKGSRVKATVNAVWKDGSSVWMMDGFVPSTNLHQGLPLWMQGAQFDPTKISYGQLWAAGVDIADRQEDLNLKNHRTQATPVTAARQSLGGHKRE